MKIRIETPEMDEVQKFFSQPTMKPYPPDDEEEDRARSIFEQCWLGPLCLLFWVVLIVGCFHGCTAKAAECKLAWNPAPSAELVTSWKVYRGIDLLATVTEPSATLDLAADLRSTLSIVAINTAGSSPPAILTVVPFTPRHSEDLRNWTAHPSKVVFIEAKPHMFANFSFPP